MNPPLFNHQRAAIEWVEALWASGRRGAVLHLWMGTGKTRCAIELAVRMGFCLVLILCPLAAVEVWRTQLARWSPGYLFLGLGDDAGTVEQKTRKMREMIAWAREHGRPLAIAINMESARMEPFAAAALRQPWPLVIVDEIHRLKSRSSAISRFAGRLAIMAHYRLGLTGTFLPHSPLDAWAQMRFVDRNILDPTYTSFSSRYAIMGGYFEREVTQWRDLDLLAKCLAPAVFQVGPEVLDLPAEQDETRTVPLDADARRVYDAMESDMIAWLATNNAAVVAANAMVKVLRLAQIASGSVRDEHGGDNIVHNAKEALLEELLEDLPEDEPVVVFAWFKPDLRAIHRVAAKLKRRSGELSGASGPRRDLPAWQKGGQDAPTILAVQIQAGSVAIDLTRARIAIYFSVGYSLADYLQSRERIHRTGQTRPMVFYHLIAQNTIDEIIRGALARRQDLVEAVTKELPCYRQTTKQTGLMAS